MKHYFLDTNVVLDFLARREPFAEAALEVFRAGLEQRVTLYVASLSFSTIYYVMRKQTSRPAALTMVANLEKLVTVVAVDETTIRHSVAAPFPDFEDGIQYYTAFLTPTIEAIITQNVADFAASALPVFTAAQALPHLPQS